MLRINCCKTEQARVGKEARMTERLLNQAFELQRFAPNARLQSVIDGVHARRAARELCDEELDLVSAAGAPEQVKKPEDLPR